MNEGRDWEGRRRRGERGWEVGGKSGVRENVGSEGINVIASHEYIENVHSGEEEEEEERQISGEEGLKERTIERTGEEEKGDEGAVGGGDREESEEQPIIPDPVTVDSSLPTTTVQIRLSDGSR